MLVDNPQKRKQICSMWQRHEDSDRQRSTLPTSANFKLCVFNDC